MNLLSDVNLDAIHFSTDGKNITLSFLDMYELKPFMDIQCRNSYVFSFQNKFEEDDGFACYIGEVNCEELPRDRLPEWLNSSSGLSSISNEKNLSGKKLKTLNLYSSEITINILCEEVIQIEK